ncbi:MAG: UDP-glucose--hexose-1-phosphate uridylyltransferase [Acholeplasmatales bacterium]|nr:UDP-glucose--hexose-1-phosphate uridylyltransferase [Acholeplasmatales bacterium]
MIYDLIESLINYAVLNGLIFEDDVIYTKNRLICFLHLDELKEGKLLDLSFEEILDGFIKFGIENNLCEDSLVSRDIFDTELMSIFTDRPSNVIDNFYSLYDISKEEATAYFYDFSIKTNYIRKYRVDKDLKWKSNTPYGDLDITINLSKPEKDPKDIERQKNMPKTNYPVCLLCKENVGYKGRLNHPARANIRLIPLTLCGNDFFMQYSPYSYYNEHCIVLSAEHHPMAIDKGAFNKLLDFIDFLPHYFVGSNADLPIVGGSILAHEHFQGGRYEFAMDKAPSIYDFKIKGYDNISCELLKWPLSVIRLKSDNKEEIVELADHILNSWINYSDEEVGIYAYTDGVRHNTITPIARSGKSTKYELDLVLRNNITTEEHPLGVFHPHKEYHHLKKENIGLIEVMGLAVLPSRLKEEIALLSEYLVSGKDVNDNEKISKHAEWVNELKQKYTFTKENVEEILKSEIGKTFGEILECCGVFKQTNQGIEHFKKFIKTL